MYSCQSTIDSAVKQNKTKQRVNNFLSNLSHSGLTTAHVVKQSTQFRDFPGQRKSILIHKKNLVSVVNNIL